VRNIRTFNGSFVVRTERITMKPVYNGNAKAAQDFVLLEYNAVSMGNRTPKFRGHYDRKTLRSTA
jgi:hypothetical protein